MLPTGHIEYTWATLNLFQRRYGLFPAVDYRLIALAALAPDLLDKPLALTLYRDTNAALFWGHNLWLHGAVWVVACAWAQRTQGSGPNALSQRFSTSLPYLLAFSGHLIADRMWGFQESLFYPLGAGHWHPWVHVGEPVVMLNAYIDIVRSTPILVFFELSGLALLGWFVWDRGLWRLVRLARFLRSGCPEPAQGNPPLDKSRSGRSISNICAGPRRARSFVDLVARCLASWLIR